MSDPWVVFGVPATYATQVLGIFMASRAKEFAAVNPTLAELIGRKPTPLSAALRDQLALAS